MPTRKVTEAILTWRQHPTEIESDLSRYHGRRIADWHCGKMSSRELLVLINHLPETSARSLAQSTSGWPEPVEMLAAIHEEIAGDNASKRAAAGSSAEFKTFVPPKDRLARYLEAIEEEQALEEASETFAAELGWS